MSNRGRNTVQGMEDEDYDFLPPPSSRTDNRQQQPQKRQGQNGNRPQRELTHDERYTFTASQLNVIGLLVLAAWLADETLRATYYKKLERTIGKNTEYIQMILEKLIESVERGFVLAPPPPLLSPELLSKFMNNRKIDPEQAAKLNAIFISKYFNLEEPCGELILRMLVSEGWLPKNAVPIPRNLEEELKHKALTAKEIFSVDALVRSEYNDVVAGSAAALAQSPSWSPFMDEIVFVHCFSMNNSIITEWQHHNKRLRVSCAVKRTYRDGNNVARYDVTVLE